MVDSFGPDIDPDYIPGSDNIFASGWTDGEDLVKDGDIVLIPQPTISPNDPLNWPKWRKYIQLTVVLIVTGVTSATSNAASAAQDGIVAEYPHIGEGVFNTGAGVLFIGIGYWTLLSAPSVFLYGSRINYLVGAILGIIGNAWYSQTDSTSDAVWSQLFVGASEAVAEAVTQLSITQIFFQHQANHFIGLYVLAISIGSFLAPLIGGIIADSLGWRWVGYMGLIASGFAFAMVFFFLEETYFDRAHFERKHKETLEAVRERSPHHHHHHHSHPHFGGDGKIAKDGGSADDDVMMSEKDITGIGNKDKNDSHVRVDIDNIPHKSRPYSFSSLTPSATPTAMGEDDLRPKSTYLSTHMPDIVDEPKQTKADKPKSFLQRYAIITPAVNLKGWGIRQYFGRLWLLLRVLTFPQVIYSGLMWGAQDAWLTFYITIEDVYWYSPPWNYGDIGVGLMNVPSLIGAVIGCLYAGYFSDWWVMYCARRNGGIREAESRLWCMIPAAAISTVGYFLLGCGTEWGWRWPAPYVGLGFIGFGWGCSGDISMSYVVDAMPALVLEGMVGISVINNTMAMIFSFVCNPWISAIGPLNTGISIGVLNFFFIMLSVPMIIWGKACRKATRNMYFAFVEKRDSLNS